MNWKVMLQKVDRYLEDALSVILYAYVITIIFAEVVARYLFHSSILWASETAIYAFIWISYLSMAGLAKSRSHLSVSFIRDAMPRTIQLLLLYLSDILLIVLATIVVVYFRQPLTDAIDFDQKMIGIDLPYWIAMLSVPVGWTLVVIRTLQRSWATTQDYRAGRPLQTEAALLD